MSVIVFVKCPYCGNEFSFKIGLFSQPPQPKFTTWREAWAHTRKRMRLNSRRKDSFVCPRCAKIIINIHGKFYKSDEVSEAFYNKIHCDECKVELDYRKCYKESYEGAGYKAYCAKCALKEWTKRIIFIVLLFIVVYCLLYWLSFPKSPIIKLW